MTIRHTILLSLVLTIALAGCGRDERPDAHAGHGHGHAEPAAAAPAADSLCTAHAAPESLCFICDPSLRDEGRLWCAGHDRYEDRCWACHPELRDPERPFCERHGLYEDECHLCDPSLRAAAATSAAGLHCGEHDLQESECGNCHPELAAGLAPGEELLVRLPSIRSAELAGVGHGTARRGSAAAGVDGYAELDYDRNRLARITPRAEGLVSRVHVDVGDTVAAGDPLVTVASAPLAAAKQAYLDAGLEHALHRRELERARRLHADGIGSERDLQTATATERRSSARVAAAAQQLRNLGLSDAEVAAVREDADTDAELVIRAPFAGEIIARAAVLGETVAPDAALLSIADLSRMWLELSLPQSALAHVTVGRPVTARFDALPDRAVTGTIVWVGSALDPKTRMLSARAEVANPDGRLKAGLYGRAELAPGGSASALILPHDAVFDLDRLPYVLVRREPDLYALRRVETGARQGEGVAVLAGLGPDETVVTGGGFTVYSELLKSRFGAGCAEE